MAGRQPEESERFEEAINNLGLKYANQLKENEKRAEPLKSKHAGKFN